MLAFIWFSLKRHMELLHSKQDLFWVIFGKEYISSQIVHTANSDPKLLLIALLFDTFSPRSLIRFSKKIHTARFHAARLSNFSKISTLFVYSILLFDTWEYPLLRVLGAWMTFEKADMAKILRSGLSMSEKKLFNHKWLDFAI